MILIDVTLQIDDGAFPEHFRWWNLNGCPNMQVRPIIIMIY